MVRNSGTDDLSVLPSLSASLKDAYACRTICGTARGDPALRYIGRKLGIIHGFNIDQALTMAFETIQSSFSSEVRERLQCYVYRLIDPRDGLTFYVGKGSGDRVFDHVRAALENESQEPSSGNEEGVEIDFKLDTINQIHNENLEVIHIIHRHGMCEETALEVEAALIDAYAGLVNKQTGHGSNDFGTAHADQITARYTAETLDYDPHHKIMVIKTHWQTKDDRGGDIYDAVRSSWRVNINRARNVEYVLAVINGVCRDVFTVDEWHQVGDRWEFTGQPANALIREKYVDKRLPDVDTRRGLASPVLYKGM